MKQGFYETHDSYEGELDSIIDKELGTITPGAKNFLENEADIKLILGIFLNQNREKILALIQQNVLQSVKIELDEFDEPILMTYLIFQQDSEVVLQVQEELRSSIISLIFQQFKNSPERMSNVVEKMIVEYYKW